MLKGSGSAETGQTQVRARYAVFQTLLQRAATCFKTCVKIIVKRAIYLKATNLLKLKSSCYEPSCVGPDAQPFAASRSVTGEERLMGYVSDIVSRWLQQQHRSPR